MKRVWQVLAGVGILAGVLVVAVVVFLSTIDPNDYRGVLSGPVKQATGRDLTFTGVRELKIGFPFAITVDGAQFANGDASVPWSSFGLPTRATLISRPYASPRSSHRA